MARGGCVGGLCPGHCASWPDLLLPLALAVPLCYKSCCCNRTFACAVGGTWLGAGELGVCGALGFRSSRSDLLLPLAVAVPLCYQTCCCNRTSACTERLTFSAKTWPANRKCARGFAVAHVAGTRTLHTRSRSSTEAVAATCYQEFRVDHILPYSFWRKDFAIPCLPFMPLKLARCERTKTQQICLQGLLSIGFRTFRITHIRSCLPSMKGPNEITCKTQLEDQAQDFFTSVFENLR